MARPPRIRWVRGGLSSISCKKPAPTKAGGHNQRGCSLKKRHRNNIAVGNTFTGSVGHGLFTYDAHGGDSRYENNIIVANKVDAVVVKQS
jgi:hypothetical protein